MKDTEFKVGDVIKVLTKDAQEKRVHASAFEGVVISRKGIGANRTFIVRKRGADGVFVERIFPLESPSIEKIQLVKQNKVRKAKLYYLRNKAKK